MPPSGVVYKMPPSGVVYNMPPSGGNYIYMAGKQAGRQASRQGPLKSLERVLTEVTTGFCATTAL